MLGEVRLVFSRVTWATSTYRHISDYGYSENALEWGDCIVAVVATAVDVPDGLCSQLFNGFCQKGFASKQPKQKGLNSLKRPFTIHTARGYFLNQINQCKSLWYRGFVTTNCRTLIAQLAR